jgi:hypothetical protein
MSASIESLGSRLVGTMGQYAYESSWVQFVKDHYRYLLNNSTKAILSEETAHYYRYRPEEYLKSVAYDRSATWLILWLNQIPNSENFIGVSSLWLPTPEILRKLYTQYLTFKNRISESDSKLSE